MGSTQTKQYAGYKWEVKNKQDHALYKRSRQLINLLHQLTNEAKCTSHFSNLGKNFIQITVDIVSNPANWLRLSYMIMNYLD